MLRMRLGRVASGAVVLTVVTGCGTETLTDPGGTNPPPNADVTAPTVTISAPADGARFPATGIIMVTGTASDAGGVAAVRVSVNGGPAQAADGANEWSFGVSVAATGTFSVSVVAEDNAGNVSSPATVGFTILGGWLPLGAARPNITAVALASDENRLLVFPCERVGNRDEGQIDEWTAAGWSTFTSVTNQCHNPELAVDGDRFVSSWTNDTQHLGFGSNINGPTVVVGRTLLRNQWGVDVTFAQGEGYMSYTSRYSDGSPFPLYRSSPRSGVRGGAGGGMGPAGERGSRSGDGNRRR